MAKLNKPTRKLNPQEQIFVYEYLICFNAKEAGLKAGYSESKAAATSQWVSNPNTRPQVYRAIQETLKRRKEKSELTIEKVINELMRLGFSDIRKLYNEDGTLKDMKDWDDDIAMAVASITVDEIWTGRGEDRELIGYAKKVKLWPKDSALDKLAKHLGMYLDKVQVTGPNGQPLVPAETKVIVNFIKSKIDQEKNNK